MQTRSISNIETRFWTSDVEAVIGIMLVLLILGTINVFSSSFILAESEYETPYFFLKRHLANMIIGISAFLTCVFVDYHRWRNWMLFTLGGTIIALILVLVVGQEINGAKRWLNLVVFTFQPAEIANSQSQDCWFTRERVEENVKNYTQFLKSPLFKKICEM